VTALAPDDAAGALAPEVAAGALAPLEAAGVLHAAMIAGTDTRPAAPARPLSTVRLETACTQVGSAMAFTPPPMLPDKIRQDQPDCPYLHAPCQGFRRFGEVLCANTLTFCPLSGNLSDQKGEVDVTFRRVS
jgi:hypothetical protein